MLLLLLAEAILVCIGRATSACVVGAVDVDVARAARAEITIAKRMVWLAEVEFELFMCVGNFPWIFMICRIFFFLHLCIAGFIRRLILTTLPHQASLGIITFILCNLACLHSVPFYLLWIIVINDDNFFSRFLCRYLFIVYSSSWKCRCEWKSSRNIFHIFEMCGQSYG